MSRPVETTDHVPATPSRRLDRCEELTGRWDRAGTSSDTADWTTTDDGNPESDTDLWLTTAYTYDALNRVTSTTAPDGAVQAFTYNEAGLFETTTVDSVDFVSGVAYNARGQRESIEYGNGVTTDYTYEPETFRLAALETTRASDSKVLQDLAFTYDPVGNIREIVNAADDTVFFDNVAVSPNQAFTYDAYYRLKTATGREKVSRGQPYNGDPTAGTLRDPYTAVALYEERYTYDAVGNITEMRHLVNSATDGGPPLVIDREASDRSERGQHEAVKQRLVELLEGVSQPVRRTYTGARLRGDALLDSRHHPSRRARWRATGRDRQVGMGATVSDHRGLSCLLLDLTGFGACGAFSKRERCLFRSARVACTDGGGLRTRACVHAHPHPVLAACGSPPRELR